MERLIISSLEKLLREIRLYWEGHLEEVFKKEYEN